ncbi:MAG: 4-alpha-glucanotransferase [Desulfuromonadales bacterium]|nr:4-alpha-glucanotransferase [Desulfuromonadales bacterium]
MLTKRTCGVLLHPTSLPGHGGIGSLGEEARRFVDLLSAMGMSFWQMLPLTPPGCGNSPYSAYSAFAGNPLLIDCDQLVSEGDLPNDLIHSTFDENRVDFAAVAQSKLGLLHRAATSFFAAGRTERIEDFWDFCNTTPWLHDYALFMAIKQRFKGISWRKWPAEIALRTHEAYEKLSIELGPEIGVQKYQQWQFFRQWQALRGYADRQGVRLFGDLPLFVAYDSADVWCRRDLFLLDHNGQPTSVAGVPPDYFSTTGQLWGNPLYNWDAMKQQGYGWWIDRFRHLFGMFDVVRIDHFRGFEAAWHVPAGEKTAERGTWVAGPDRGFFETITATLGKLPIIVEDLGVITPAVEELRDHCGYPGMKILQFAFDSDPGNPYLPHNHVKNCVVYTGTHDNNTTLGWGHDLSPPKIRAVMEYIGCKEKDFVEGMLRMALMSVANTVIVPFQDLLGLPSSARMNIPGTASGNWGWRFSWSMIPRSLGPSVRTIVGRYGRLRSRTQQIA